MGDEGLSCRRCAGRLQDADLPVTRHSYCVGCHEPLHCCRMCRFFSEKARENCLHDDAAPPLEKESGNFCEFFRPGGTGPAPARELRGENARRRLNSLFGDETPASGADGGERDAPDLARARLNDLFNS